MSELRLTSYSASPPPAVAAPTLAARLTKALVERDVDALTKLEGVEPIDDHDAACALLYLGDLYVGPIDQHMSYASLQRHPSVAAIAFNLDQRFLARLGRLEWEEFGTEDLGGVDAVAALRALAHSDRRPELYDWIAEKADAEAIVSFLGHEGGPDGGFDDLVAICQLGLAGEPKLEMAQNYWDEMGNGRLDRVHTELHRKLSRALDIQSTPRESQSVAALERSALSVLLATNRWLQPELVGALGLIELQAGPRCRRVVEGLQRVGAPWDAVDFYAEHQEADPRHGADWLRRVVSPLADDPVWASRIVRGARWRATVNNAFLDAMADKFGAQP